MPELTKKQQAEILERIKKMNAEQKKLQHAISVRKLELPVCVGAITSRPQASSAVQRSKRRQARGESVGRIEAKVTNGVGELLMFGTIGDDWFGEGITANSVDTALKDMGSVETINVRANSGGGDVFEATAIYHTLTTHPANINMIVEGVAASAMTLIAMAGDKITISENAHWMVHAASGLAYGNADELRQYLKLLDNADSLIRLTYAARTGISDDDLAEMMSFDNWMTAAEALEAGFVDEVDPVKSKAKPHTTPDDSVTQRPTHLSPERLAAASGYLSALSAVVLPKAKPGSSPQSVTPSEKENVMNAKLRARCVAAGMSDELTNEEAEAWFDENEPKLFAAATAVITAAETIKPLESAVLKTEPAVIDEAKIVDIMEAREKIRDEKTKAWRAEVDATVELALGEEYPSDLRNTLYAIKLDDMTAVRAAIVDAKAKEDEKINDGGVRVSFKTSQPQDRHRAAIKDGLMLRCLSNFTTTKDVHLSQAERLEKHLPAEKRAKGCEDFQHMKLVDFAKQCLLADGMRAETVMKLADWQVAQAALGYYQNAGIRADGAIHTTGSLSFITQDAINKSLLAGYEEAPQTWRGPGRQAASVSDFKTIHRIKLGAASNLPVWPDNTDPERVKLSNEEETYAVEARAETIEFSWRLVINDDLDALSRRPQVMGDASARTVNALFWQQWTANAALSDGQAIFLASPTGNRKRSNLTTGAATPTNATINAMAAKMMLMRGLNTPEGNESEDILALMPEFIIGPPSLRGTILKEVRSSGDPADDKSSAVYNTSQGLIPIIEPLLESNSATAWYLSASPSRVDTCEVTFLAGQETPVTHVWMDDRNMAQNATIIQTFAAKFIDHRGVQKHDGA